MREGRTGKQCGAFSSDDLWTALAGIRFQNLNQDDFYYILIGGSTQEKNSYAWYLNTHMAATIQYKVNTYIKISRSE